MKKRNVPAVVPPVVESEAVQDVVREEVCRHFQQAFKSWKKFHLEIHFGMLKAMKDSRSYEDVQWWLIAKTDEPTVRTVRNLANRYLRILEDEWRKADFLNGKKDFWEASLRYPKTKSRAQRYHRQIREAAKYCDDYALETQIFCTDFCTDLQKYRVEYNRSRQS